MCEPFYKKTRVGAGEELTQVVFLMRGHGKRQREARQATTGTYPSCLVLIRPANAAAQLTYAQAGRKEQGPPLPNPAALAHVWINPHSTD